MGGDGPGARAVIRADDGLRPADLEASLGRLWQLSAGKILDLEKSWSAADGSPVFTQRGRYTARGWTDWTQGFQFGSALLQFDATGQRAFLELGRERTYARMAPHVTHMGVHDHGFNNVSTWGALRRLMLEGRYQAEGRERELCELALKASGAVQARRWTRTKDGGGYIYSFNGPHSLFADTMRSLRSLALAHRLGQTLLEEGDRPTSLLERLLQHAGTTARFAVYRGSGRDSWDEPGRVAHESVFNVVDGSFRCPSTQQGYSPFTTWTRGQAWVLLGFAEQLEFLETLKDAELQPFGGRAEIETDMLETARVVANPENDLEPVDSSSAAIAAQGLLRLGRLLEQRAAKSEGLSLFQAGLTVTRTLLGAPYLSEDPSHQGLLLHSVYHRPNGWDYVPKGRKVPYGESSQWGDYHLRELALHVQRLARGEPYYAFYGPGSAA